MSDETTSFAAPADEVERELDRLSLEQALLDFDVANSRVNDLTERLIAVTRELNEARQELGQVQAQLDGLRDTHDRIRSSAAFRLANLIRSSDAFRLVNRIRRFLRS